MKIKNIIKVFLILFIISLSLKIYPEEANQISKSSKYLQISKSSTRNLFYAFNSYKIFRFGENNINNFQFPNLAHSYIHPLFSIIGSQFVSECQLSSECFTVLVGKDASNNGAVFMAHNEDDYGTQIVNIYKVPNGDNSYLWFEMPGMEFSDSFLNEHGVMIVSNQCYSREDKPELNDGGIRYELRQNMAEKATSAREAIKIAAALIERYGYDSSGRSYCIADRDEAWIMSVVNGKHWAAARIPDDHVAVIPNYYTITNIDINDTVNYLCSKDIIDYAIERGWCKNSESFNFRKAYGDPKSLTVDVNIWRNWIGINWFFDEVKYALNDDFPFSFKPDFKIDREVLMALLRNHYERTDLYYKNNDTLDISSPHHPSTNTVCADHTQYGIIGELNSDLPVEAGIIVWYAPRRPCIHPFIPIYAHTNNIHHAYFRENYQFALNNHFNTDEDTWSHIPIHAYWIFADQANLTDSYYQAYLRKNQKRMIKYERNIKKNFEKQQSELINTKLDKRELVTKFSYDMMEELFRKR